MNAYFRWLRRLKDAGAILDRIRHPYDHYVYGTRIITLVRLSKEGIVYGP